MDMNLPPAVAEWLRREGHDALRVREQGQSRLTDREIFARAAADRRVVTFGLDFGEIAAFARDSGVGVLLLRLRAVRQTYLRQRLRAAIAAANDALAADAVIVVEDARVRVRHFGD